MLVAILVKISGSYRLLCRHKNGRGRENSEKAEKREGSACHKSQGSVFEVRPPVNTLVTHYGSAKQEFANASIGRNEQKEFVQQASPKLSFLPPYSLPLSMPATQTTTVKKVNRNTCTYDISSLNCVTTCTAVGSLYMLQSCKTTAKKCTKSVLHVHFLLFEQNRVKTKKFTVHSLSCRAFSETS